MEDLKKRVNKAFYERFQSLRIAEFIGNDYRTELAKESVAYAIGEAEKNHQAAMECFKELTEREAALVKELKLTIDATEYDLAVEGTNITYVQRIDLRRGNDYVRCKEVAKEIVRCVNSHQSLIDALEASQDAMNLLVSQYLAGTVISARDYIADAERDSGKKVHQLVQEIKSQIEAALLAARGDVSNKRFGTYILN